MYSVDIETPICEHLSDIKTIHCIGVVALDGSGEWFFDSTRIREGLWFLVKNAQAIIGHNFIQFDLRVIKQLYPKFPEPRIIDTLIISKMLYPDREVGHSLKSWGGEVGIEKIDIDDFSILTEDLAKRCLYDCRITAALYKKFLPTIKQAQWTKALRMEHKAAHIIAKQEAYGWSVNKSAMLKLQEDLTKQRDLLDATINESLPVQCYPGQTYNLVFLKNGGLRQNILKVEPNASGAFSRVEFRTPDVGSQSQLKKVFFNLGWKPDEWNYKKDARGKLVLDDNKEPIPLSPKITETSLESLQEGLGAFLAKRFKVNHRLNLVTGLIERLRPDGRLESQANPCATNTARMTHRVIVNIPKADPKVFLGHELRSLFTVPDDSYRLVGCDASALEFRCLAHYVNDPLFTKDVLEGDIHTTMQRMAGLETRAQGKTLCYAVLYGAGDGKIGKIVDGSPEQGRMIREALYDSCPNLASLLEKLKKYARMKKYVPGIDGRPLYIRSAHSALNVLLQGCGAIVMKTAMVIAHDALREEPAQQVGIFHDEMQYVCKKEVADKVAVVLADSIEQAGRVCRMRCPLKGESKIGMNWAETH